MATASNIGPKNGYNAERLIVKDDIMKVLVVGDRGCGKSAFIKSFSDELKKDEGVKPVEDAATIYKCYDLKDWKTVSTAIFFYELDGSEETANVYLKEHNDSNAVVVMYAVDDPASFENAKQRWIARLEDSDVLERYTCAIVVGNKKDLRENQQVIQSLAQNGESPITVEQGRSLLKDNQRIREYFDCSSIEPYINTWQAFKWIVGLGEADVVSEVRGYHMEDEQMGNAEEDE